MISSINYVHIYIISDKQLKKKFKHASDFGIVGCCSLENVKKFKMAIEAHLQSSSIQVIKGTYRKKSAVHYFNPQTSLNVLFDDNQLFWSGWKLTENQIKHLIDTGNLGGS
ncbi:MAG: colicin D domain-containing protein [Phormidium sp.]